MVQYSYPLWKTSQKGRFTSYNLLHLRYLASIVGEDARVNLGSSPTIHLDPANFWGGYESTFLAPKKFGEGGIT